MATIVRTTLQLYRGTSASGTKVGNDIVDTTVGGPPTIELNYSTLGAYLNAGDQYFARVKALNDQGYETDWDDPNAQRIFKTLILAEIVTISGSNGVIRPELSFTYNNQVLSVQECGVYVSTSAGGTNAQKIAASNEQEAGQGWDITGLAEGQTYHVIPYVIDSDGREYKPEWTDAETVNTGYKNPVVTLIPQDIVTTYNSISGPFGVTTNDTLTSVYMTLQASGGTLYRFNKTASAGTQYFTITDGDTDSNGATVAITPNTTYTINVYATNTSGGTGSAQASVTTATQGTSTITITGVTPTPTSATVNISYGNGNGGAVVNPDQQQ